MSKKKKAIPYEAEILRDRRLELEMTQTEVALAANIQLRQYQRLEYGEFHMSGTSMKVGLAICKALELDPFLFAGQEEKNM